jgi:hypothetical protein
MFQTSNSFILTTIRALIVKVADPAISSQKARCFWLKGVLGPLETADVSAILPHRKS